MATVTHSFVSTVADEANFILGGTAPVSYQNKAHWVWGGEKQRIRGSHWNANHAVSLTPSDITGLFANPTNPGVNLTGSNGSAATAMRSDAVLVLDQSITPTWTGLHVFKKDALDGTFTDSVHIHNTTLATLGTQVQNAPTLSWHGNAWNTSSVVSQEVGLRLALVPSAGNPVSGVLQFAFELVGGAYAAKATLSNLGVWDVTTGYRINSAAASGHYLRGDGTNYIDSAILAADLPGSFSGFANPTASIGLTAVNGTATTAMRSDAAPALSQAITPTWTAQHNFAQAGTSDPSSGGMLGIGLQSTDITSAAKTGILFQAADSGGTIRHFAAIMGAKTNDWSSGVAGYLSFWTRTASGSEAEAVRILDTGGVWAAKYLNVGALSAPANTTAGDFTSIRMFNTGGRFDLINATANHIFFGNVGAAVPGAGSAGEKIQLYGVAGTVAASDYALGIEPGAMWISTGGDLHFYDGAAALIANLLSTGSFLWGGYGRVGATSTPANTTVGDFTAIRGRFGTDAAIGTSYNGAAIQISAVNAGSETTLKLGDDTANGYVSLEFQSRYTGASGAGKWKLESIDTAFYLYNQTGTGFSWYVQSTGEFAIAGATPVANVAMTIANKTYSFKFLDSITAVGVASITNVVPVLDASGNIRYIALYNGFTIP